MELIARDEFVLVSWIARNNDPYGQPVCSACNRPFPGAVTSPPAATQFGPTLTLLFDPESPYCGRIGTVVLLYRDSGPGAGERSERVVVEATLAAIRERAPTVQCEPVPWDGTDPTDHGAIFAFLQRQMPEIRRTFRDRKLLVHVSPGTPAMHTIWVLMAECGYIGRPFELVQSFRSNERRGRPAVVPVRIGIETFFRVFQQSQARSARSDERVSWDPTRFRTARLKALVAEAQRLAVPKVPILILGERGTGKTSLAGWIRAHSPYRRKELDQSWPSVACGQYTRETMRAELFGYVKGAFTDAKVDRDGLLATADGDSLFLDEVGDVSRDLQRLLIRALEEKRFYPIGSAEPRQSDFRLVTATNLAPDRLRERLDADFLDRIGVLRLRLPSLREIPEELDWMWEDVLARAAACAGMPGTVARVESKETRRIVAALRAHPLPGNVRDLYRVAYRLVAALADTATPLSATEATEYALAGLATDPADASERARAVAAAFAGREPLDGLLLAASRIETEAVFTALKAYLAREVRRIAKQRGVVPSDLCDVTDRSLLTWAEGQEKRTSSPRKGASDAGA